MNPTQVGVTTPVAPLVDTLHTLRLPRTPRDAYRLHQLVATLTKGADRHLWATPRRGTLIIRSPHLYETVLPPGVGVTTTTTPIPGDDARVEWALIANPTKAVPTPLRADGTRPRGRRHPLEADEVPAWVSRKLSGPLADIAVTGTDKLPTAVGYRPKSGHRITHTRYAIAGTATVTDQQELAALLHAGVGTGKAFGSGLLIVREVS